MCITQEKKNVKGERRWGIQHINIICFVGYSRDKFQFEITKLEIFKESQYHVHTHVDIN